MNYDKVLEYRITRGLVRAGRPGRRPRATLVAETVIRLLAATAAVALVGAHLPELLWAGLGASLIYALGMG
jgi:hypothetical protein